MANTLYTNYANTGLGSGAAHGFPDLDTDDIRCVLTDHGADTPNPAVDLDRTDITAGTVATSGAMTGESIASGAIDYADFSFSLVVGNQSESLNWYEHTGDPDWDALIVYFDTATGLPVTPSGGDIRVKLHASGLFTIGA